jgi:hypothetical protein
MVVQGAPGIGKSSLLEAVGDELSESGWLVLRTSGTPSEQRLPFAGLQQLLRPIMVRANDLFVSQRVALFRAFGLVDAVGPRRRDPGRQQPAAGEYARRYGRAQRRAPETPEAEAQAEEAPKPRRLRGRGASDAHLVLSAAA